MEWTNIIRFHKTYNLSSFKRTSGHPAQHMYYQNKVNNGHNFVFSSHYRISNLQVRIESTEWVKQFIAIFEFGLTPYNSFKKMYIFIMKSQI